MLTKDSVKLLPLGREETSENHCPPPLVSENSFPEASSSTSRQFFDVILIKHVIIVYYFH